MGSIMDVSLPQCTSGCICCCVVVLACSCTSWSGSPMPMRAPLPAPTRRGREPLPAASSHHPAGCGLVGLAPDPLDHATLGAIAVVPWNRHPPEEPLLPPTHLDEGRIGQAHLHRTLLWPRVPLLWSAKARSRPRPTQRWA